MHPSIPPFNYGYIDNLTVIVTLSPTTTQGEGKNLNSEQFYLSKYLRYHDVKILILHWIRLPMDDFGNYLLCCSEEY